MNEHTLHENIRGKQQPLGKQKMRPASSKTIIPPVEPYECPELIPLASRFSWVTPSAEQYCLQPCG